LLSWSVNGTEYSIGSLSRGDLPGHTMNETDIIVTAPFNGTSYTCIASSGSNKTSSNTAYLYIAGKYPQSAHILHTHAQSYFRIYFE